MKTEENKSSVDCWKEMCELSLEIDLLEEQLSAIDGDIADLMTKLDVLREACE